MFRGAAHPLCAVTPQARLALREPGLHPSITPPEWESRGLCSPLARVWGEEPQPSLYFHAHTP